jgi:hypothetical protein
MTFAKTTRSRCDSSISQLDRAPARCSEGSAQSTAETHSGPFANIEPRPGKSFDLMTAGRPLGGQCLWLMPLAF